MCIMFADREVLAMASVASNLESFGKPVISRLISPAQEVIVDSCLKIVYITAATAMLDVSLTNSQMTKQLSLVSEPFTGIWNEMLLDIPAGEYSLVISSTYSSLDRYGNAAVIEKTEILPHSCEIAG